MHRFRSVIAGIVLSASIAGCGGSSVDEGPKPFTPTDTSSLKPMIAEQQEAMKKKAYTVKAVPPDEKKKDEKKK